MPTNPKIHAAQEQVDYIVATFRRSDDQLLEALEVHFRKDVDTDTALKMLARHELRSSRNKTRREFDF